MCLVMHFVKDLPNNHSTEKFHTCTQMKALLDVKDISNLLSSGKKNLTVKLTSLCGEAQAGSSESSIEWTFVLVNMFQELEGVR